MVYKLESYQSIKPVPGLFYYVWSGRGSNGNACLLADALRGERRHVIIDPGYVKNELLEPCFEDLARAMKADDLNVEDIGLIINTHRHSAHCAANEAITERSRSKGGRGRVTQAVVAAYGAAGYHQPQATAPEGEPPCTQPLILLGEGVLEMGKGGKLNLTVIHTPGHSPDSLALYWAEQKVLFTGDTVLNGNLGRTDQPGGDAIAIRKSVDRLRSLDAELLVPGHATRAGHIIEGAEAIRRNYEQARLLI